MKHYDIREFGAVAGEVVTQALQRAIDEACKENGVVVVPEGRFIITSVDLKNVTLMLEKGAVLQASGNVEDYTSLPIEHNEMPKINPILYSVDAEGIYVMGQGTIDLNARGYFLQERDIPPYGCEFTEEERQECTKKYADRSHQPIFFQNCKNIRFEGVTIEDAPSWTFSFNNCERIWMTDLQILNDPCIPNNDGIHLCGCKDVFIRCCYITAGDDCIALSGITDWEIPCERIVISDCILESSSKAIVLGYMHSIVRNVTITNCQIRNSNRGLTIMCSEQTGLVENVSVSNCLVDTRAHAGNWWGNGEPICVFALYHNNTGYKHPIPERNIKVNIRNVSFSNIVCHGENVAAIVGNQGNIENISLSSITYVRKPERFMHLKGVGKIDCSPAENSPVVEELESTWLYVKGVKNLMLTGNVVESGMKEYVE